MIAYNAVLVSAAQKHESSGPIFLDRKSCNSKVSIAFSEQR